MPASIAWCRKILRTAASLHNERWQKGIAVQAPNTDCLRWYPKH